jgi:mutator protein MutT
LINKDSSREVSVAVAVILADPAAPAEELRVLLARRSAHAIRGGLWEFPGGKVEPGEAISSAAIREAGEEVGIEIEVLAELATSIDHDDRLEREQTVHLHAVVAAARGSATPRPLASEEVRWASLAEIETLPMPRGNRRIHEALLAWAERRSPSPR